METHQEPFDQGWPEHTPVQDWRKVASPIKGRGTATALAHRFARQDREAVDDGWSLAPDDGAVQPPPTIVTAENVRSILSRNDSPDIPFTWGLNPYRGCEHGCIYCYARPTHSYLNLSPGLDFETRLVAKVNAAEVLCRELAKPSHVCSGIAIGSATDAYQPIEREWRITREVLEVLNDCQHPFSVITKSSGVERDLDILSAAAARRQTFALISITSLDSALSRKLEPRAAAPHRRLQTVKRLTEAGVHVSVNIAPIIPFLNEPEIEHIVEAAIAAGAKQINYTIVRLPWEVKPLFEEWLQHHVPDKAERIMARIRDMRGGKAYDAAFGERMKGTGIWADLIKQRVRKAEVRHGVARTPIQLDTSAFMPQVCRDRLEAMKSAQGGHSNPLPQMNLFT